MKCLCEKASSEAKPNALHNLDDLAVQPIELTSQPLTSTLCMKTAELGVKRNMRRQTVWNINENITDRLC